MDPSPRTSDAPEIFYHSCRTYRNFKTVLMLFLALLFAAPFVYGIFHKSPGGPPQFVFYIGAFVFLGCFLTGLDKIVHNTQEVSEISSTGIVYRKRQWGWSEIISIKPARQSFSDSVRVQIKTKNAALIILLGSRPLTPEEYATFADRLRQFLAARYPQVQVER